MFYKYEYTEPKHNFTKFVNVSDYSYINNFMQLQQTLENANIYNELDHDLNHDLNEMKTITY